MIEILVSLIILGVVLYLVNLIPMPGWVKQVINVVAVLYVVLYALQLLGVWHGFPQHFVR
jgi:hypothetical protein